MPTDLSGPLRICFVTQSVGGGVERHVVDLSKGLLEKGHSIHLIHANRGQLLPELRKFPAFSSHYVPMKRAVGLSDLFSFMMILLHLRTLKPFDIIHGHSSKGGAFARLLRPFAKAKIFYTSHALYTSNPTLGRLNHFFYSAVERVLSHWSDGIILVSPSELTEAKKLGLAPHKLFQIENGVPPSPPFSKEEIRKNWNIPLEAVVIGFTGRLESQKNPELFLTAAAPLLNDSTFAIVIGSGSLESALKQKFRHPSILWLGSMAASPIMGGFDIFALTSRYEGFPYVLLEALASGLPIVSTPVGGTEVTVFDGRNGFIADDSEVIAERLRTLILDLELRKKMGANSLSLSEAFPLSAMVEKTLTAYRKVPR